MAPLVSAVNLKMHMPLALAFIISGLTCKLSLKNWIRASLPPLKGCGSSFCWADCCCCAASFFCAIAVPDMAIAASKINNLLIVVAIQVSVPAYCHRIVRTPAGGNRVYRYKIQFYAMPLSLFFWQGRGYR